MDHGDNKHCTETPWSERYHYKDNSAGQQVACGVQDNPTRVQMRVKSSSYPTFDFEVPRQNHDLEKLETMLQRAYQRGKSDNREQIGKLMRDLIAL